MGNRKEYLTHQIVKFCQTLDRKGFVANHDGNISVMLDDYLLATPTAEAKAAITPEMIISLDMQGKKIAGIGKPFSEIKLHLAAYRARENVKAVVHAHPPFSTARGLVEKPLEVSLPEAVVSIGDVIPVTPFAMPGAAVNDEIIFEALQISDVFMMPGNGVLAIGDNLEQAYLRLELVEHIAKIDYYAHAMGTPMSLSESDLQTLLQKRASIGLGPQRSVKREESKDPLRELIAREIKKVLQGE